MFKALLMLTASLVASFILFSSYGIALTSGPSISGKLGQVGKLTTQCQARGDCKASTRCGKKRCATYNGKKWICSNCCIS
jgi:hypothetical protein